MLKRIIPASGELLPVIGLGTWQTFDVSDSRSNLALTAVLTTLQGEGGSLIDSSPMYGRSEQVIGDLTAAIPNKHDFFYATKVWTTGIQEGIRQMETSMQRMQRPMMDLMQIHNLTDWQTHLPQLQHWKENGKIRYTGITHYTDASHDHLGKILLTEDVDFVQFNYSILSRNAEKRLFDIAVEQGVATIINRPFGEGNLLGKVSQKPLPSWAAAWGIDTWSAFFLKFIISHPAVTCVIPATANPQHALENLQAGAGPLPDEKTRHQMVRYVVSL